MYRLIALLVLLIANINSTYAQTQIKTIHILIALCDNKYQGIVSVPAAIGNGQDPRNNLYWGAGYGLKTYFNKQKQWQLVSTQKNPQAMILERLIYKNKTKQIYIVADAYDGQYIKNTIQDFFNYSAGAHPQSIEIDKKTIKVGGKANLLIYVGHNGLMDWSLSNVFSPATMPSITAAQKKLQTSRQAAVFACKSQQYFSSPLSQVGISPAILTTHYMAPEGYVVYALVDSWVNNKTQQQTHEQVAKAYSKYQKLKAPARKLFTTDYQ